MGADRGGGGRPLGLVEYLFAELRQGLQDIRQKLLEEGWFGRVVSAEPVIEITAQEQPHSIAPAEPPERGRSFDELWLPAARGQIQETPANNEIER